MWIEIQSETSFSLNFSGAVWPGPHIPLQETWLTLSCEGLVNAKNVVLEYATAFESLFSSVY